MVGPALSSNPNLVCSVCGENDFQEREGFYYCIECGTKHEQLQLVEVEQEDDIENKKLKTKKQKINTVKAEKPQLTSWECYNYILRGFVEELLSLGAKEELKLMALQVWAAYLRRMEIAFFSRKQADLPKLGLRYLPHDAKAIYNHSSKVKKKRKQIHTDEASCTSGAESTSAKTWRKNKRKLDELNYSTSATSASFLSSSTSAFSNRAIKIGFSSKARKFLKKKMPKLHIEKHASDAEGLLKCHKQPNSREIKRVDYYLMTMNIKQIYCILGIALNLIGDDIQLSDLLRFIQEDHLSTNNVLQYFPQNIASNGEELLKNIDFYKFPHKFSDKCIRDHINILSKNIGIYKFKNPDITKLVKRYTTELCLPSEIAVYIERLINLVPPQFDVRKPGLYANFEARAMAYIIFTLKLLFGLDGKNEYRIAEAAQKLNKIIDEINDKNCEKQPHLFVWNEWVKYVEMRKIIISKYSSSFCEQFKQTQSTDQILQQMSEEIRFNEERELLNDTADNSKHQANNLKTLLESFRENLENNETNESISQPFIIFKPSFTPALSYFKNICLLHDKGNNANMNIYIPDFMHIDHSVRDIKSYLEVKPLIAYFQKHNIDLKVYALSANKNKTFLGIFRSTQVVVYRNNPSNFYKAAFDITEEEWAESVAKESVLNTEDIEFKTEYEEHHPAALSRLCAKKTKMFNPLMNYDLPTVEDNNGGDGDERRNDGGNDISSKPSRPYFSESDLQSTHSFEIFSENNMDPLRDPNILKKPRRNLENINLFEDISDEESVLNHSDDETQKESSVCGTEATSSVQNIDPVVANTKSASPDIFEEFINSEDSEFPRNCPIKIKQEKPDNSKVKQNKKPAATKKALEMYVSNMDCWTLLGYTKMLSKAQRLQLQDKFPRSFNWLLETCAQTIGVDWSVVYEQLICIEVMFCLRIENLDTLKDCVYIKSKDHIKDIQVLMASYGEVW